jgi:hypothetical protein
MNSAFGNDCRLEKSCFAVASNLKRSGYPIESYQKHAQMGQNKRPNERKRRATWLPVGHEPTGFGFERLPLIA